MRTERPVRSGWNSKGTGDGNPQGPEVPLDEGSETTPLAASFLRSLQPTTPAEETAAVICACHGIRTASIGTHSKEQIRRSLLSEDCGTGNANFEPNSEPSFRTEIRVLRVSSVGQAIRGLS